MKKLNLKKLEYDWKEDCRFRKRTGLSNRSFDDYIKYRLGKFRPKLNGQKIIESKQDDHRIKYPSAEGVAGVFNDKKLSTSEKLEVSRQYIIGQAYNKGGFVVLSKSEAADPNTGKRRP